MRGGVRFVKQRALCGFSADRDQSVGRGFRVPGRGQGIPLLRRRPNGRRVHCVIDTGEVLSSHLAKHARLEIDIAGFFRQFDAEPAVPHAGAGHQANHKSGPAVFRPIGFRAVDKKGIVERDLASFQKNGAGFGFIKFRRIQFLVQRGGFFIVDVVFVLYFVPMRTRDDLQASIFNGGVVQRDPGGTSMSRFHGPVVGVLVPGRFFAHPWRFTEDRCAPQDDVRANQLFGHVENIRKGGELHPFR